MQLFAAVTLLFASAVVAAPQPKADVSVEARQFVCPPIIAQSCAENGMGCSCTTGDMGVPDCSCS